MPRILHWFPKLEETGTKKRNPNENRLEEKFGCIVDSDVTLAWIYANMPIKQNFEHYENRGFYWDDIKVDHVQRFEFEVSATASAVQIPEWKENPLDNPPLVSASGTLIQQPTNVDWKNNPICTTAGELIQITEERVQTVFHVEFNSGSNRPDLEDLQGCFNDDAIQVDGRIRARGTLKFTNFQRSAFTVENGFRFKKISFDLIWDPLTHAVRRWNRGTLELVEMEVVDKKTGKKVKRFFQRPILTETSPKKYVDEPVFLDVKGRVIEGQLTGTDNKEKPPFDASKLIELSWYPRPGLKRFSGVLPRVA